MLPARRLILSLCFFLTVVPMQVASCQSKPYSIEDVIAFVRAGVSDATTLNKAKTACINFHLTSDAVARLRAASADDALIAGLVSACYRAKNTQAVTGPPPSRPTPARQIVKHDTVLIRDTVVVAPHPATMIPPRPTPDDLGQILVPEATEVAAMLEQSISSKDAQLGDRVKMTVAEDVFVRGHVVIAKGTRVRAEIADVKHAGLGIGGKLTLRLMGTTSVDEQQVPLRATKVAGVGDTTVSVSKVSVSKGALSVIGVLFGRHGNDITFKAGTIFAALTDEAVKVSLPSH